MSQKPVRLAAANIRKSLENLEPEPSVMRGEAAVWHVRGSGDEVRSIDADDLEIVLRGTAS